MQTDRSTRCARGDAADSKRQASMSRFAPTAVALPALTVEFAYADGIGSLAALDGIVPFFYY